MHFISQIISKQVLFSTKHIKTLTTMCTYFIRKKTANHSISMLRQMSEVSTKNVAYAVIVYSFITTVLVPRACKYVFALKCNHIKL